MHTQDTWFRVFPIYLSTILGLGYRSTFDFLKIKLKNFLQFFYPN